jgi:hypothetical protein
VDLSKPRRSTSSYKALRVVILNLPLLERTGCGRRLVG